MVFRPVRLSTTTSTITMPSKRSFSLLNTFIFIKRCKEDSKLSQNASTIRNCIAYKNPAYKEINLAKRADT